MRTLTWCLALWLCACTDGGNGISQREITIGVLPDQTPAVLKAHYDPLLQYLRDQTGLEITLSVPTDYGDLLEQFVAGRFDLANFGAATFIQAERRSGAVPLVMRDVDLAFTSCYLVAAGDRRRGITDFEGESFAFGPTLSTSGHLMPRYFLARAGIDPEAHFGSVRHSSGHDDTAALVRDGEVTIGVANCSIVDAMLNDGRLPGDAVRILDRTPPYADYVWATQSSVNEATRIALRDAFLALDINDPAQRRILHALGAEGYLPAGKEDFDGVRTVMQAVGLFHQGPDE